MLRHVEINQPLTYWMYAGPYITDVSDLYQDNYTVPIEPFGALVEEARQRLYDIDSPVEGDTVRLFNIDKRWKLYRPDQSEKKVVWACYGQSARMMVTFAYNEIVVKEEGVYSISLQLTGGMYIFVNGRRVFESLKFGREPSEHSFEIKLERGVNRISIMLANVHLHCMNSFLMRFDEAVDVRLPLVTQDLVYRESIEEDLRNIGIKDDIVSNDEPILLRLDAPLKSQAEYLVSVYSVESEIGYKETKILDAKADFKEYGREFIICKADLLNDGRYKIQVDCVGKDEKFIPGIEISFKKISLADVFSHKEYSHRERIIEKVYIKNRNPGVREGIFLELVKLKSGENSNDKVVREAVSYVNKRFDCSDFVMHGLLRLYIAYCQSDRLSAKSKEIIKACILKFKYSEQDGGRSMMFTRSENHEILFYSAEYLAGLLFPEDTFKASGKSGRFHMERGFEGAESWINKKLAYGFNEWLSNTYYEEDMLALLALYDFGEERIKEKAGRLIKFITLLLAMHSYKGVLATTHGRCYEDSLIHPETEGISHINYLLFGKPEIIMDRISMGAVALMTSGFSVDPALTDIAGDEDELFIRTRMGFFSSIKSHGVNCATYRTKDYMVSGMVESRAGEFGAQVSAGQVLLDGNIPVFVTCFDVKSDITRPSYWGGQYRIPKAITFKNLLAYIYNIETVEGYTHCYFPFERLDEVVEHERWLFGRKNRAYIALYSLKPYQKVERGLYRNRELMCLEKRNIWLIETGSGNVYGNFVDFIDAITNAALIAEGENIKYISPSVGEIELGWDIQCRLNGRPILEEDYPLIDCLII